MSHASEKDGKEHPPTAAAAAAAGPRTKGKKPVLKRKTCNEIPAAFLTAVKVNKELNEAVLDGKVKYEEDVKAYDGGKGFGYSGSNDRRPNFRFTLTEGTVGKRTFQNWSADQDTVKRLKTGLPKPPTKLVTDEETKKALAEMINRVDERALFENQFREDEAGCGSREYDEYARVYKEMTGEEHKRTADVELEHDSDGSGGEAEDGDDE